MNNILRFLKKAQKTEGGSIIVKYGPKSAVRESGFSDAPVEWQDSREAHYKKWLGGPKEPLVWHEMVPLKPHVDIHVFPPSPDLGRNFFTLITSGMSDERMYLPKRVDKQFARAELIFYIDQDETQPYQTEKPWYVKQLLSYAYFPFEYRTWLGPCHTMPNGDPPSPVIQDSSLTTAIFLPAIFERKEFTENFKLGGEKVNFLWLSYLTDRETEFKLKYGFESLVDHFNENNFPRVFNPFRASIV